MPTRNPFLINWVRGAYSMELGLVPMLERQTGQFKNDPELQKGLELHLQKTRKHVELLRDCLQRLGENASAVRPIDPVTTVYGHPNGGEPDTARQAELFDYVTEAFEVASYRALQSLTTIIGDQETARVCQQILDDEIAIADALDRRLVGHNGHTAASGQDNTALARENFSALNAHDLDHFDRQLTADFRSEVPGTAGALNRAQNRAYLETYLAAFPDLRFDVQRATAAGDDVVVEWIASGTHTGTLRSSAGPAFPATHRPAHVRGSTAFRFKDGKIAQSRIFFDTGEILRQLGLVPGAEQAARPASESPSRSTNRGIVHLEIPAADRKTAARFYSDMFGWEYEHMGEPMNYTSFKTGNIPGGFPDLGDMYEPGDVIFYIESDNIDADLRRAEKLGGKTMVPRTEIPGYGWFAILADPTGNRVGLFSA
jgi:steroid delta-isomerase-like uncharacterized protein